MLDKDHRAANVYRWWVQVLVVRPPDNYGFRAKYMGLEMKHPIVASASPLSQDLDGMQRSEDAGAAAIVMFSLFEEQIQQEAAAMDDPMMAGTDSIAESVRYFPEPDQYHSGTDQYLELIQQARTP